MPKAKAKKIFGKIDISSPTNHPKQQQLDNAGPALGVVVNHGAILVHVVEEDGKVEAHKPADDGHQGGQPGNHQKAANQGWAKLEGGQLTTVLGGRVQTWEMNKK